MLTFLSSYLLKVCQIYGAIYFLFPTVFSCPFSIIFLQALQGFLILFSFSKNQFLA